MLVENRQALGFDAVIPAEGLAIWHVDETKGLLSWNSVNTEEGSPFHFGWPANGAHYRVALLQADGLFDLELGWNRGDAGRPLPRRHGDLDQRRELAELARLPGRLRARERQRDPGHRSTGRRHGLHGRQPPDARAGDGRAARRHAGDRVRAGAQRRGRRATLPLERVRARRGPTGPPTTAQAASRAAAARKAGRRTKASGSSTCPSHSRTGRRAGRACGSARTATSTSCRPRAPTTTTSRRTWRWTRASRRSGTT